MPDIKRLMRIRTRMPTGAPPRMSPWRERARHLALKGLSGGLFYGMLIEPRWVETTLLEFPIVGLPRSLDGYRIVHLTDLHHNVVTRRRFLSQVIETANALQPDLVVLTGDYITHNPDRMRSVARCLGTLRAPDGIVATLGNHDYRCPMSKIRKYFIRAGITLLENEHRIIYPRRLVGNGREGALLETSESTSLELPGGGPFSRRLLRRSWSRHLLRRFPFSTGAVGDVNRRKPPLFLTPPNGAVYPQWEGVESSPPCLCVSGVGDLWEGEVDLNRALIGAPHGVFRLLLSHNPEVAHLLTPRDAVDLVLAGHTHGGQAWVFDRPLMTGSAHQARYLRGLVQSPSTYVYVSRGVGTSAFHFRWNCRPEVVLVRLRRAENDMQPPVSS